MSRDEAEGQSPVGREQGRGRGKGSPRGERARTHLRRLALEGLERRQLLTTSIPSATIQPGTAGTLININAPNFGDLTDPTVAVDPSNPNDLIAAYISYDPNHLIGGQINTIVEADYSVDGGHSWLTLGGGESADDQADFSAAPANPTVLFTQTTDPQVGFDRAGNAYLLTSTHSASNASGILDLQRFDFRTAATTGPVQTLTNKVVYSWQLSDAASQPTMAVDSNLPSFTDTDASGNTYVQTDPSAGNVYIAWSSTDTNTAPNGIVNFNPNSIKMIASSDQGQDFSHASFVDNLSNANFGAPHSTGAGTRYVQPSLAISQGRPATATSPAIPGGQVSVIYDDYGTDATVTSGANTGFDRILDQTDYLGGTSDTFAGPTGPIGDTPAHVSPATSDSPLSTLFNIPVDITDPQFTTLNALDVRLDINWPNLQELSAVLLVPQSVTNATGLTQITLFNNGVNGAGTVIANSGLSGANLGKTKLGPFNPGPGTVFDPEAIRSIRDGAAQGNDYVGHYQPEGFGAFELQALKGLSAAQLNGVWTLVITDFKNDTTVAPMNVNDWSLNFTSGNDPGNSPTLGVVPEVTVADDTAEIETPTAVANPTNAAAAAAQSYIVNTFTTGVSDNPGKTLISKVESVPILPSPTVAVDNTLGAFSQHQGRIYVSYIGRYDDYLNTPKDTTEVILVASDDGGQTWTAINPGDVPAFSSTGVQVNDDNAATDGFSEANAAGTTGNGGASAATGRPKLDAKVAVDDSTGAVVVSFYDARNDASRARVATYIAVSGDGGATFAPNTYANPSSLNPSTADLDGTLIHAQNPTPVIDAITGKVVDTGPTLDNQSGGNPNVEAGSFGFGTHLGLAVSDGTIIPVWASNQNLGSGIDKVDLGVVSSILTTSAGPRVISSTEGPVGQPGDTVNTLRGPDGGPVANTFLINFDRPIDPATFNADGPTNGIGTGDVRVFYQDPYGATTIGQTTPMPTVIGGTTASTLSTVAAPGVPIVEGRLTLNLTGFSDTTRLTVALTAPDGQSFFVPIQGDPHTTATSVTGTFPFPANMVGGLVNGTYHLFINDSLGQVNGKYAWSVQLNGVPTPLLVTSVTPVPNLSDPLDDGTLGYTQFKVVFRPVDLTDGVATGVGTYSYIVRPNISDRIRSVGTPIPSAGVTNLVLTGPGTSANPTTGQNTSTITVTGHPNQFLVDNVDGANAVAAAYPTGTVAVSVSATILAGGTGANARTLATYLVTPDGHRYSLGNGAVSGNGTILTYTNKLVTVPFADVPLDGQYTLVVVDNAYIPPGSFPVANQTIAIGVWQVALFGKILTPTVNSAPATADGLPGGVPVKIIPAPSATAQGITNSTLSVVGHANQVIGAGTLNVALTDSNVANLTLVLTNQFGQSFTLPAATGNALNQSYLLPASFLGQLVDGAYTLSIRTNDQANVGLLTAWSLVLTPSGFVGPFDQSTSPAQLTAPGSLTSSLFVGGPVNEAIASGVLDYTLTASRGTATGATTATVNVAINGPNGQQILSTATLFIGVSQAFTVALPASFLNAPFGTYSVVVTDNTAGDAGETVSLDNWSVALAPKSLNGNAMDQNANGTTDEDPEVTPFTGLTPGDDYAVPMPTPTTATALFAGQGFFQGPYSASTLPLIVSGPHIVATNVTGTSGNTTGDSPDHLVANDQVNAITATFDRNVQIKSVTPAQILSIIGPSGPITGSQTFTSTGIAKTFTSTNVGLPIPRGGSSTLKSTLPILNTGLSVSSLTVTLNITDPVDSSLTLTLIAPDGTQVPLAANVGGNGANFTNTTFSDTAAANGVLSPIAAGKAPFSLTYTPASPLSALAGKTLDGTWTLQITDNTPATSNLPLGRLNAWSLAVTPLVPQAAGSTLTSTLTVNDPDGTFKIGHLAVRLNISAAKDSDVAALLIAPDGSQIPLFAGVGGVGSNFANTTFDDLATLPIAQGVAPFNLTYIPVHLPNSGTLSGEVGKAINGTWQLMLADVTTDGLPVTLNSWSLIATPQITITPRQTYVSTDTSATTYPSNDASRQVYASTDVTQGNPLAIPTTPGTIQSTIQFSPGGTDPFLISDLQIAVSIAYPRDSNLSATLTGPDGTTITLFAAVGGNGANFGGPGAYVTFSDSGTLGIAQGRAPFDTGSILFPGTVYRPAQSLLTAFGGKALNALSGTWTLTIHQNQAVGAAGGDFLGWAMLPTPRLAPVANGLPVGAVQVDEPIPVQSDSSPVPLISTITLPSTGGKFTIANLNATLTLTAPNLAFLKGVLVSPSGLIQQTLFDFGSLAGTSVTQTFSNLVNFQNTPLDGTWSLEIYNDHPIDGFANGEVSATVGTGTGVGGGQLNGWSLTATPAAIALAQAPEPIPGTPASSLSSTITIPDDVPLNDLQLRLDISAPKTSDLTTVLIGPGGQVIPLFANVGAGANFANTLFDDHATVSIADAANAKAPYSATFKPLGTLNVAGLSSIKGTWTLIIKDTRPNDPTTNTPDGLMAVLNSWSLINTPPSTATLANSYQVNFPTQQLSGTYQISFGAGIQAAAPSVALGNALAPADPTLGTLANPALNAGVDVLRGTSNIGVIATSTVVYNAAAVPAPIRAKAASAPSVLNSQINVPDNFIIQGVTAAGLGGLTVQVNIQFPNDPDLAAVLIAPDGTRIALFTNVGNGANKANFNDTIFDDTVNPPAPVDSAGNGFFGRFNPETPLSDLAGKLSGGVWTLQITNGGVSTGSLLNWSLTFQKPLPSTGLGDPVTDRQSESFRLFNIAPTNPLANDTWTAVGPAGVTTTAGLPNTFAGSVATVAYDPSDPTRNTVYVGASSGGIWKTTNFLTNDPGGPTYVPLTDFGPNFGLNVGSIATYGRNGDPGQTILFAGTGFAQATYPYNSPAGANYANYGGTAGRGVGLLRSFDGGMTWTLLDSLVNTDASGNLLPIGQRDHNFVGDFTYKVLVDPTPLPNGGIIVYAAMGGPTGGLYRSIDGGNNWQLLSGGLGGVAHAAATDVIFDLNSKSPSSGNIDIVYAAFSGLGVFESTNRGQGLFALNGQLGINPLITDYGTFPTVSTTVGVLGTPPNSANDARIVLAKPALTGNAAEDLLYQDWIYASVESNTGRFIGLYITKDRGQNWTRAQLQDVPDPFSTGVATPTNDDKQTNNYDPTANQTGSDLVNNGNYSMTMTVDPTNPNIVYLGGTSDFQDTGLIRVDLTNIRDAHNFTSFDDTRNDGGQLLENSVGGIAVGTPNVLIDGAIYIPQPLNPASFPLGPTPYLNFRHAPNTGLPGTSPFNVNATLVVENNLTDITGGGIDFINDGTDVKWTAFNEPLKANAGDPTGSTNLHDSTAFVDPVTGNVRLIFADDQGVFTAVVNPDGTLDDGIGTAAAANYSRNGNLQDEQFYYGAAQPSNLAAQAAGALFYASGQGLLAAQSDANILNDGNITWDDSAVLNPPVTGSRATTANAAILSSDRGGTHIATDPTGGTTVSNPIGTGPALYEYDVPSLGGNLSDFFRVNGVGQTTGLDNNFRVEFPFGNYRFDATSGNSPNTTNAVNGLIPEGNFAVNPLNGSQILISSTAGTLYETTTRGTAWAPIGQPTDFNQPVGFPSAAYASALAYGAPDSTAPGGIGNLNNFIYVGTVGGNGSNAGIFVTRTGGQSVGNVQGWINISNGLDGSSVLDIYPSPNRNSHEAYAVTLEGIYYTPDSLTTPWSNITGNLTQIQHNSFGDPALAESQFATYGSTNPATNNLQLGGFRSIVADYRYAIPDLSGAVHPVLYAAGYGGVFRSLDNGQTWTQFPNTSFDSAPVDGGYLPSVEVESLTLNLGAINPATGRPAQVSGDPEVLLATTDGRGDFAIRLAPDIFPTSIHLDATKPAPLGSATGTPYGNPLITNQQYPFLDGVSEISNFGNVVTISLIDENNPSKPVIGIGTTDAFGQFSVQVGAGVNLAQVDPSFLVDGAKTVGIQATDSAGAKGNVTTFSYTLKHTPPLSPGAPDLEATSDSGRSQTDNITNVVAPVFDVTTAEPSTTLVELLRSNTGAAGSFIVVATAPAGSSPVRLTDSNLTALAAANPNNINQTFYYETIQVDQAGNPSVPSAQLPVTVITKLPTAPTAITLDPSTNSGPKTPPFVTRFGNPLFDVTGVQANDVLQLFRTPSGGSPASVGFGVVNGAQVQDVVGVTVDGTYFYQANQIDIAGNLSPLSPGLQVTITRKLPAAPTLNILPADDSGLPNNPQITNVRTPRLFGATPSGSGTAGDRVDIINQATGAIYATTAITSNFTYATQITTPLADGTYPLVARITDSAGNQNFSAVLNLTIKATGPRIIPTLSINPSDDTGLKGDGVTAVRTPRFIGVTDPGSTVKLYAIVNGQDLLEATATASTINGSFSFTLPNALVDGATQLVAQASDLAGNVGSFSPILNVRIVTVTSDYADAGSAQLAVFRPVNSSASANDAETYYVRNVGAVKADVTPGRDVPIQNDIDIDGKTDYVAYQFDTASYVGFQTTLGAINQAYGTGGNPLPVSGNYSGTGAYTYALYLPSNGYWVVNLPTGVLTYKLGTPNVDIPVPAAYDGGGTTEIAVFRPLNLGANDGDEFIVHPTGSPTGYQYTIPFSGVKGFTYKLGDIPAPADFDGVGRDEFAIYRPSTGQYFILNTPNVYDVSTWTLRTVTLNLPGGAQTTDQPAPADYDGNGKADPTVYRPNNSTFYVLHSSTGQQESIQFGDAGVDIAAAGPLLYRLSALRGIYATGDGYPTGAGNTSYGPPSGGTIGGRSIVVGSGGGGSGGSQAIKAESIVASPISTSNGLGGGSTIVASPSALIATTTTVVPPTSQTPVPSTTTATTKAVAVGPVAAPITVGANIPRATVATEDVLSSKKSKSGREATAKAKAPKAQVKVSAKPAHVTEPTALQPKARPTAADKHHAVAAAIHHLASTKKGRIVD